MAIKLRRFGDGTRFKYAFYERRCRPPTAESAMAGKPNAWTVPLEQGGWVNRYEGSSRIMARGNRRAKMQKQEPRARAQEQGRAHHP